jgi:hypothetical protein
MQQGRVYFLAEAAYLNDVHTELLRFPTAVHDDIVDALAWAVNLSIGRSPRRPPAPPKPLKSWKDKLSQYVEGGETTYMSA